MLSSEYRSILGQLPIKCPTAKNMATLCPHLTTEEAVKAFTSGTGYVACPPLRIRHGFQIVSYSKEWVEKVTVRATHTQVITGTKNHPALLNYSYAGRTRASYEDRKSHGDVFASYKHIKKALAFAENNWGEELILDDWIDVVEFYIQDPTHLVNDRYHHDSPRTKAILRASLSRDWNEIHNDGSKPKSQLIDEAISQMTLDSVVWHELRGGRGGFTEFNCAHCGAGLGLTACSGCGHRFRDDQIRCGWPTPLSPKMVKFLRESGHVFKVDPEISWKNEQEQWVRTREETVWRPIIQTEEP